MSVLLSSQMLARVRRGEIAEAAEKLRNESVWSNEAIAQLSDDIAMLQTMLHNELRRRAEGWRPGPNVPFNGRITMGSDDEFQVVDERGQRWIVSKDEWAEK